MNDQTHRYYIPASVTVGIFKSAAGNESGFVTCKYMDKGWLKTMTFERLTGGYGPSQSKDPETQLKKIVHNKVVTFANDPVEGFKITGRMANIYKYKTGEYNKSAGDVILQDPRGFEIGICASSFTRIVSGAELSNGAFLGKYSYAWTTDSSKSMILLKEGSPEFEDAVACRVEFDTREKPKINCVKKKELAVGHAYTAAKVLSGDWIYAGIRDTYSDKCHMAAFDNGEYDIGVACENEKDWASSGYYAKLKTSTGRMAFFPVKFDKKRPWVSRADVTGVFEKETACPASFHFFDSPQKGVPPTVESIEAAIACSPVFQRIDFARFKDEDEWEPLDPEVFSCMLESGDRPAKFMVFPFDRYYYAIFKSSNNSAGCNWQGRYAGCWIRVSSDSYAFNRSSGGYGDWRVVNLSKISSNGIPRGMMLNRDKLSRLTYSNLYSLISPVAPKLYFENGNRVPQHIAALFIPKDIRSVNNQY